jgi:predicted NodU family carbamoyl transferase
MDIAASIQVVTEMAMMNMARFAHRETGLDNLCLAGGVALNCVGNGKILREGPFKNLWIQPAAGDAGGALGAACSSTTSSSTRRGRPTRRATPRRHAPRPVVLRRRDRDFIARRGSRRSASRTRRR